MAQWDIFITHTKTREWEDCRVEVLRCPYCHSKILDAWELPEADDLEEYECEYCGKVFEYTKELTYVYTTYKKED